MSYAVVHMQKISKGGVRGIQSHNQREKPSHNNPDIDYTKSHENYDLHNEQDINYNRRVSEVIEEFRKNSTRAVRKDAVVLCNFIVSSDKGFFEGMDAAHRQQFFLDSYKWFADRYGMEHVVNAVVHMDETTPHMHLGIVPITSDGRLSAKSLFDKKEMIAIQTDFALDVGSNYGLSRGVEGSDRTHLSEVQFKAAMAARQIQEAKLEADALIASGHEVVANNINKSDELLKETELKCSRMLLVAQDKVNIALSEKSALEGQIEAYKALLTTANDIESIGKRNVLTGKVTMADDEAKKLKSQAISYFYEKSKAESALGEVKKVSEQASSVYGLREKIIDLKREIKEKDGQIQEIRDVIRSDRELLNAFQEQSKKIQESKKEKIWEKSSQSRGFER